MTITIHNRIPRDDLALGLVRVEGIVIGPAPQPLADELELWIDHRNGGTLTDEDEAVRKGSRDMLRNGVYKPTGRGKPASEYLARAANEGNFPRINGPVDANNLVSLKHCVPISVWDLDLAGTAEFEFRLGLEGEVYVFNPTGQELGLQDLVCGCELLAGQDPPSRPVVTPIKDSLATKLRAETTRLAGCLYYPLAAGNPAGLEQATAELLRWLELCGPAPRGTLALCLPGQSVEL
jgi:DNA/RNA-binding domain of Phe-tRNA-synthetase-like protein